MQLNQVTLLQTIRQYKLFPPNSRVLVAVSGGTDSLALLHLLAHLRLTYPLNLVAASFNHGIRPEAKEEQAFVQQMANLWDVPSILGQANVPLIAKAENLGIESAARKARYDFLAKAATEFSADFVITAHHADDQIETILMHIIRGSGLQGLTGMQMNAPMPNHPHYRLLRPLLPFSRASIEAYCAENSLEPRQDTSNFDTTYRRNAIRHEIVPRLRQLNPQIDSALSRLGEIASAEDDYIKQQFKKIISPQMEFTERVSIRRKNFLSWHITMQRRAILIALDFFKTIPDFERIESAIKLIETAKVGAILEFSEATQLRLGYDHLHIEDTNSQYLAPYFPQNPYEKPLLVPIPSLIALENHHLFISNSPSLDDDARIAIPEPAQVLLRSRRAGDRFSPLGMGGHSLKLKEWFIDHKIPQHLRDKIPLIEVNGEIAAIILHDEWAISESFAVHPNSSRILYFKVKKL